MCVCLGVCELEWVRLRQLYFAISQLTSVVDDKCGACGVFDGVMCRVMVTARCVLQ